MRLWTVHPRYLDVKGLTAAWREGLLAQKVLANQTRGYKHHPQLERFRAHPNPPAAIANYLRAIAQEADQRGYHFDATKITNQPTRKQIEETTGQSEYEWQHLKTKLQKRAPELYQKLKNVKFPKAHPLFRIVPGEIRGWERPGAVEGQE